jgi:histidinol phosphatase-like PHP family hydrolase
MDRELVLAAVNRDAHALGYASVKFKRDREIVLATVNQNGIGLVYASRELRNDREIVIAAVNQNGSALQHASRELRNDREVVLAAVKQSPYAGFLLASVRLKNDSAIFSEAVSRDGLTLQLAHGMRNNREIVLIAVRQNGNALEFASEELKNDREIVIAAVKQHGGALRYASEELKNDREIVIAAVKQYGGALAYASNELKNDREIVIAAVNQNGVSFVYCSNELKGDRELILLAIAYGWTTSGTQHFQMIKDILQQFELAFSNAFMSGWCIKFPAPPNKCYLITNAAESAEGHDGRIQMKKNKLPLLNKLGKYSSIEIKKLIAGSETDHCSKCSTSYSKKVCDRVKNARAADDITPTLPFCFCFFLSFFLSQSHTVFKMGE